MAKEEEDRYLYRAKGNQRYNSGKWYEGYLIKDEDGDFQIFKDGCRNTVLSDTICQCTGRTDENKKLIFEHDIVAYLDAYSTESGYSEQYQIGEVLWDDETLSFQVTNRLSAESYEVIGDGDCRVVGNIFDNPELLEQEGW